MSSIFNRTHAIYYVIVNEGILNVTITSPANESSHYRGSTITLTALIKDQNGNTVSGATVGWYNTTANIDSGESGSWTVPVGRATGTETITCNATKGNYSIGGL